MQQHIYVHFPYCLYRCHYCDFNSYAVAAGSIPENLYVQALIDEWRYHVDQGYFTGEVNSVFFGGGTPSLLQPQAIATLLAAFAKDVSLTGDCEITLEANPGTIDGPKLKSFALAGINRLSLGVQSLHEAYLQKFGRIHTALEALQAVKAALSAHIPRVSVDLIFGFPGQTLCEWQQDVETVTNYPLKHISCYALTAEPGTLYYKDIRQKKHAETGADEFAQMLIWTHDYLKGQGLESYEISNFAESGEESRHNLGYWRYEPYLGLGAGAVSTLFKTQNGAVRLSNIKGPESYRQAVMTGRFFAREDIDLPTAMFEFIMMGLRTVQGICSENFARRFGVDFFNVYATAVEQATGRALATWEGTRLKPTRQGLFLNHQLVGCFM